jgi:hypothetical protein
MSLYQAEEFAFMMVVSSWVLWVYHVYFAEVLFFQLSVSAKYQGSDLCLLPTMDGEDCSSPNP